MIYIERARKAVQWSLARYKEPANYGNLGFWHGAYADILYSEWHLATGDATVLPNLDALRDWTVAGQKASAFGIPALGYGPGGLPYRQRGLVAPACHLLVAEALAMRGAMESGIWEIILPYMGEEDLINAAYALVLQAPRRSLHLTGKPR